MITAVGNVIVIGSIKGSVEAGVWVMTMPIYLRLTLSRQT